nr:DUF3458 domain-containing protein [Burkholderiaceae bacterium]
RDWFQLSLKEGLTVFRDQEFSADRLRAASPTALGARWAAAVKRIEDVRTLRSVQFAEDAGPQAHAVRPDHYQEINNFYTATVYEKGAEVVRMLHTILGPEGFKRGLALYFERHDGQAVTCDDFLNAMRDANHIPLPGFELWYSQAGTPRIVVSSTYDESAHTFELTLSQHTNATADAPGKEPVCLPITLGLVLPDGTDATLRLDSDAPASGQEPTTTRTVLLTQAQQCFKFLDVPACPVPSLLRGFSAPAELDYRYSDSELILLAKHDSDPFNRWEAVQRLAQNRILAGIDALLSPSVPVHDEALLEVYAHLLESALTQPAQLAPAFLNQALRLPDESTIAEHCAIVDPVAVRSARLTLLKILGTQLKRQWQAVYEAFRSQAPYQWSHTASARRALSNLALRYWAHSSDDTALVQARKQLDHADNMTDREAALIILVNSTASFKAKVLLDLARSWSHEPLLMNKWFRVQATAVAFPGEPDVLSRVKMLTAHNAYHPSNPNNVYALVLAFCAHNLAEFHREDGSGYDFWVEQVQHLDRINPTVAARLARSLDRWRKFTPTHQKHMQTALRTVAQIPKLSTDVQEIIHNALKY